MNDFFSMMNSVANGSIRNSAENARTENEMVGYKRTAHALLDMNYRLASYRTNMKSRIADDVRAAYKEDAELALKFLFYARDILQGAGERDFFREAIRTLALDGHFPAHLVKLIPEYGRWDDVFVLRGTPLENEMLKVVHDQFVADMENYIGKKSFSLLAKWMPSVNTSNKDTCKLGYWFAKKLGITPRQYRKTLASMRARLAVIEPQMCANKWESIKYENVPSRANALYKDAFLRHDYERRVAFLGDVVKGEKKINAATLYPYDIVHKYTEDSGWSRSVKNVDITLEELWKKLPQYATPDNTLIVADGSGSMTSRIGTSKVTALDVANSLAIYFAEKASGVWNNRYITFSDKPQFVQFRRGATLRDKIVEALHHNEIASTNIEAVFELILSTARTTYTKPADMPANIIIISDMEFNQATDRASTPMFENMARKFNRYGYKLPKLVFWNVNSRTGVVPMQQNENGVVLVSGFSPAIVKMVLTNELDPYKALITTLNNERYAAITLNA